MSLSDYRGKRDPDATPEPFADEAGPGAPPDPRAPDRTPIFVVQRHEARRLHYDFRLERGGVLASWAVPKGIPLEPGAKALAVHVEDHPLSYASFHGEIPAGQYGAGTVEIWDHGTYDLVEERPDGRLTVALHGTRLEGIWSLVPAHMDGKEQNWLLIRRSGGSVHGSVQGSYGPMLATLTDRVPAGDDWVHEVKFDGYRVLAYCDDAGCRLLSRNGNDLTGRFAEVAAAAAEVTTGGAVVLDGEVCRLDPAGRASFSELQQGDGPLVFYVFDLLEAGGERLVDLPLAERRSRLRALVGAGNPTVRLSEEFGDGTALLAAAQEQGLEGIVSKRRASRYVPGTRSRDWRKTKVVGEQEFVVAGYTRGTGRRAASFGSLVLAVHDGSELRYAGNVGTGFDDAEIGRLLALLKPLRRELSPFPVVPKLPRVRRGEVQWVEPELVVQVKFTEWTHDGHLRHPSYLGLRDDRQAAEVTREGPSSSQLSVSQNPVAQNPVSQNPVAPPAMLRVGRRELRLTNLDKVFWPEEGITKGELLGYYRAVAPVLLPHLASRPFTMRRYPDGAFGKAFFQKDAPSHMPEWIPTFRALVTTREESRARRSIRFPVVNDELALLWMVNMGCIDLNTWYSRIDRPDRADFVLFDLDPTPETPWAQTIEVALVVKSLLDQLGLRSFPKTSGGKGFHILVPLDRRSGYAETRAFAEHVAGAIARTHPKLATTEWSKARRRGVLIDANQNGEGKTIASVYSVRPKPHAPVSTPLAWDEVDDRLDPASFTMAVVLERVGRLGDLYADVLRTKQSLARALRTLAP